jgi:hypothetical protein
MDGIAKERRGGLHRAWISGAGEGVFQAHDGVEEARVAGPGGGER